MTKQEKKFLEQAQSKSVSEAMVYRWKVAEAKRQKKEASNEKK